MNYLIKAYFLQFQQILNKILIKIKNLRLNEELFIMQIYL